MMHSMLTRAIAAVPRLALTGLLAGWLAYAPSLAQEREDEDLARGRALATKLCARCHLNPGQGEKSGPDGIPGFAAVARRPEQTRDGIVRWLRSVPPMMPDHHLTQDEMFSLAAYILSLKQ